MKYKMNKKGAFVFTTVMIIVIALALLGIGGGLITTWKINQFIKSIPTAVWIGFIILILLLMLPKRRK